MSGRIDVGLLGATGTVGRRIARLLEAHPWFQLAEVGASQASAGRGYGKVLAQDDEDVTGQLGAAILNLPLKSTDDIWRSPVLISALPSREAGPVEERLARAGHLVVSNAASHRMDPDVPLVIPEVNPDHLELLKRQERRWPGGIVTNPNCSVVGLAMALAPLHRTLGVEMVTVATLQALSGAGRRGPSAAEMLDNVIPHIPGEEEKLAREPQKILGELAAGELRPAPFAVSAHTHRVPVVHGHLLAVSVKLRREASLEAVGELISGFRGALIEERLPTGGERALYRIDDPMRPQPRLDRDRGNGMSVSVGRIRRCEVLDVKFSVLVHNLIRGAAGAALLNAELCHVLGLTRRARDG